jgi:hypothetical protein
MLVAIACRRQPTTAPELALAHTWIGRGRLQARILVVKGAMGSMALDEVHADSWRLANCCSQRQVCCRPDILDLSLRNATRHLLYRMRLHNMVCHKLVSGLDCQKMAFPSWAVTVHLI